MLIQQFNHGLYRLCETLLSPLMGKSRFRQIPVFVGIMLATGLVGAIVGEILALALRSAHHYAVLGFVIGVFVGLLSTGAELLNEL